jgi:peptidoglycan/xylan/chitin deacetylase (PgdA/CDA1 family)
MSLSAALTDWQSWVWGSLILTSGLWFSLRYAWWRPALSWDRPRVLMYHLVTPHPHGTRYRGLRVPPEIFEQQLAWLKAQKFHFGTMRELAAGTAPARSVVLTFDDGYADNLHTVTPLLQKFGARATLYLVAVRDDGTDWSARKKAHHDTGELVREPKLTDDQVRAMLATGCWELGAHTLTHPLLTSLSDEERHSEIGGSRQLLQETFGVKAETFAYTFGIWSEADKAAVRDAGFATAVTTDPGAAVLPLADPLAIPRIKISGKEGMFAFRLRVRTGRRGAWK